MNMTCKILGHKWETDKWKRKEGVTDETWFIFPRHVYPVGRQCRRCWLVERRKDNKSPWEYKGYFGTDEWVEYNQRDD